MAVDHRQHHVAVVHVAEQRLHVPRAARGGLRRLAEAEAGRLEDVAQALGGDAHVVLGDRVRGIERRRDERAQLAEAHGHDARGVLLQRGGRIEPLHAPRLHAALSARLGSHTTSSGAAAPRRFVARNELRELIAERRELVLGHEPGQRRVRVRLLGAQARDQGLDARPVGSRHRLRDLLQGGDRDVAVAPLAECVRERLHRPQCRLQLAPRKARSEDLERGAQPPRRHAHVVDPVDVVDVEHALGVLHQLGDANLHDARGGGPVRLVRLQPGNAAGLGHQL